MKRLLLACTLAAACQDALDDDGADDSFLDEGKSDTGGIREDSSPGYAVLRVANESDAAALDAAGVTSGTAKAMIAYRAGADGLLDTSDDDRFDTLAELDAVPYTGPVLFQKLLDRAMALGYIIFDWRTHIMYGGWSSQKPTVCTISGSADAKELRLLFEMKQSAQWRVDIRDSSNTLVQSISPPFTGWSQPIPGHALTYQIYGAGVYWDCEDFRGLPQAVAVKEPVALDDPFRCTTFMKMSTPTPSGAMEGELGMFALPNVWNFNEYAPAFIGQCSTASVAVKYTPPTDGLYTFQSFEKRHLTIRDGGCAGPELACGSTNVPVKLRKGQSIAIGVGTSEPSFTWVTVVRSLTEVSCSDGFDDNGDGAVDCADPTCAEACRVKEVCTNGIDDNGNGKIDCLDDDCGGVAACSSNTCPGLDLGTATGTPVAEGNATLAPAGKLLACGSTAQPWAGSRFFSWRAPTAGTYRFHIDSRGVYHAGIKLLDGTCDADVLGCAVGATTRVDRLMAANQEVVVEVGLSRRSLDPFDSWTPFELSITKL